jgi:tetratricopeptide (TPR) repeat protein
MLRLIIALVIVAFSISASAEPAWTASETAHFIIYSKSPRDRVEQLATDLESYDKLIRMATGIREDVPVKVRVYEVDGMNDVQKALGMDSTTGVAGFYTSNSLGPYLVTPRNIDTGVDHEFTAAVVLHHEYAHHLMLQYFPAAYPSWYVEGFAELIGASKVMSDGRIGYGMPAKYRGNDIATVNWVPLQELLTREKVYGLDTYAQGWAVTHFFTFDKTRSQQFRQYLQALNAGHSLADAAKVFGDLDKLDREARAYVTGGSFEFRPVKVDIAKPVIESVRTVSPGEAALIPQVIAYSDTNLDQIDKKAVRDHELTLRQHNLERTRDIVRQYPNDPFALRFLAEIEYSLGNYAQSQSAADRLLAIDPNNVHALARKAMTMAIQARSLPAAQKAPILEQARAMAANANHLDTQDPLPLLAYYETFHEAGEAAPAVAVEGLRQVVSTDPRDTVPRELLVDELASERQWAEAIGWLAPLASDPHDSPVRDSARTKMAWLKAQLAAQNGAQAAK